MKKIVSLVCVYLLLGACAGPTITRVQPLSESADAPYGNVLVVSLFQSFDMRRYFEQEIVKQLKAGGIDAVASTSMMDTKTPVNRDTFLAMVKEKNSDAVLVTQLVNLDTKSKIKDRSPEATYNIRPTYYYNVWSVELTEYEEPPGLELTHSLTMATQLFSARSQEPVWAIESSSKLKRNVDQQTSGTTIAAEAKGIISAMSRDGLLVK